jgi:hypothetical protein
MSSPSKFRGIIYVVYAISAFLYTFVPVQIEVYKRKTVDVYDLVMSVVNLSLAADKVSIDVLYV